MALFRCESLYTPAHVVFDSHSASLSGREFNCDRVPDAEQLQIQLVVGGCGGGGWRRRRVWGRSAQPPFTPEGKVERHFLGTEKRNSLIGRSDEGGVLFGFSAEGEGKELKSGGRRTPGSGLGLGAERAAGGQGRSDFLSRATTSIHIPSIPHSYSQHPPIHHSHTIFLSAHITPTCLSQQCTLCSLPPPFYSRCSSPSYPCLTAHCPSLFSLSPARRLTTASTMTSNNKEEAIELKNKGNDAFKKQDYPAAVDFYTKAIDLYPDEPSFYTNRAQVCLYPPPPPPHREESPLTETHRQTSS